MKRYEIAGAPGFPGPAAGYESPNGAWVRYEAVERELAALRGALTTADRELGEAYEVVTHLWETGESFGATGDRMAGMLIRVIRRARERKGE